FARLRGRKHVVEQRVVDSAARHVVERIRCGAVIDFHRLQAGLLLVDCPHGLADRVGCRVGRFSFRSFAYAVTSATDVHGLLTCTTNIVGCLLMVAATWIAVPASTEGCLNMCMLAARALAP